MSVFFPVSLLLDPKDQVPTVTVARPLFVIRGTYYDPLSERERPLPPHAWVLGRRGSENDVWGQVSDDAGLSVLFGEGARTAAPELAWGLILSPVPKEPRRVARDWMEELVKAREFWIDLDRNEWVPPSEVLPIESRRLLRMPIWASAARYSIGFNEVPPWAKEYASAGVLRSNELQSYGTLEKPWTIQVDHGLYRAHVRFQYYDWQRTKVAALDPGLVVRAVDARGATVGGGMSYTSGKPAYVLVERRQDACHDVHFSFAPGDHVFIDLKREPPQDGPSATDQRWLMPETAEAEPRARRVRYPVPARWHSLGMEARIGSAARQEYEEIQKNPPSLSSQDPLVFDLDDLVLRDRDGRLPLAEGDRVALFDRHLTIRDAEVNAPHRSKVRPSRAGLLSGPDAYYRDGNNIVSTAFVVYHGGEFYGVGEERHTGELGIEPRVGARVAVAGRHPSIQNPVFIGNPTNYELHFFADALPGDLYLDGGGNAEVCHLMVHIPVDILKGTGATDAHELELTRVLEEAGLRWDQEHPAHTGWGKRYVIVPEDGANPGARIVKLRHFFAPSPSRNKLPIRLLKIADRRSFVLGGKSMMMHIDNIAPASTDNPPHDSDGIGLDRFTLAHEFGHVMGLVDEYIEPLNNKAAEAANVVWSEPMLPRFLQSTEGKPFALDTRAMMRSNALPRLRYGWQHARWLEQDPMVRAVLGGKPQVFSYPNFAGGLRYKLPDGNRQHPWTVVARSKLSPGFGDLLLYHLGDDEGSVEAMFGPRRADQRLDGLVIVRTKFWFNFAKGANRDFNNDVERYQLMRAFHTRLYDGFGRPRQRMLVQADAGARLRNLALFLQPQYEFGPEPTEKTTEADADLVVDLIQDEGSPELGNLGLIDTTDERHRRLRFGTSHLGVALMRYALHIGPYISAPDGRSVPVQDAIQPADLSDIAAQVCAMLGEPPHSRTVSSL